MVPRLSVSSGRRDEVDLLRLVRQRPVWLVVERVDAIVRDVRLVAAAVEYCGAVPDHREGDARATADDAVLAADRAEAAVVAAAGRAGQLGLLEVGVAERRAGR